MFGNNPRLGPVNEDGSTLLVKEHFVTLQGEGPYAGLRSYFIRLAGCPLQCWFCDTPFDEEDSISMGVREIVKTAIDGMYGPALGKQPLSDIVVITGGEPFRWPLAKLINSLNSAGFAVHVETSGVLVPKDGTIDLFPFLSRLGGAPALDGRSKGNRIIVAPKTGRIAEEIQHRAIAYKYVIRAGEVSELDGLPNVSTQKQGESTPPARPLGGAPGNAVCSIPIYVMPCDEYDEEKNKANRKAAAHSALNFGYRLGVQMHKLVDLP